MGKPNHTLHGDKLIAKGREEAVRVGRNENRSSCLTKTHLVDNFRRLPHAPLEKARELNQHAQGETENTWIDVEPRLLMNDHRGEAGDGQKDEHKSVHPEAQPAAAGDERKKGSP